jgi:hypothetical protein
MQGFELVAIVAAAVMPTTVVFDPVMSYLENYDLLLLLVVRYSL